MTTERRRPVGRNANLRTDEKPTKSLPPSSYYGRAGGVAGPLRQWNGVDCISERSPERAAGGLAGQQAFPDINLRSSDRLRVFGRQGFGYNSPPRPTQTTQKSVSQNEHNDDGLNRLQRLAGIQTGNGECHRSELNLAESETEP